MPLNQLLEVMSVLRQECPWDKKQTPKSLTKYAIEEAYEVEDAVRSGNIENIKSELGDLLLQVVFQSQMYSEQGEFDFNAVVDTLTQKLIRRHPHVFQKEKFDHLSEEEVRLLWQTIKKQEKSDNNISSSKLSDVKHGPSLQQAQEIQERAASVGFDFENIDDAFSKVDEELNELKEAIRRQQQADIQAEFGDCLFALINVGRKLNLSSEMSLLLTTSKFRNRFAFIEEHATAQNKSMDEMTLKEMDELWEQAKVIENK